MACSSSDGGGGDGDDRSGGDVDADPGTAADAAPDAYQRPDASLVDADPSRPDADVPLGCGVLPALVRDFNKRGSSHGAGHDDFEAFQNDRATTGLINATLDAEGKPSLRSPAPFPQQIKDAASFAQWYRDVPGVNMSVRVNLALVEQRPGFFVFDDQTFFPVDNAGFNEPSMVNEGLPPVAVTHNFHFTTEVHTSFVYKGGEQFTFIGDDDLWLFINGHLVIDLGGLHGALTKMVSLDALAPTIGMQVGQRYPMDIFHAERRTDKSTFRIETTIECLGPVD
jgi:fibro-slime domain-containing protein